MFLLFLFELLHENRKAADHILTISMELLNLGRTPL
jgi:hypothetical protein